MTEPGEVREPLWLIAANVVRFPRGSPHPDPCRCHECLTLTPE